MKPAPPDPDLGFDFEAPIAPPRRPRGLRRALCVLWPAFVMAGVTQALLLVLFDPAGLSEMPGPLEGRSPQAVHALIFFLLWVAMALSSTLCLWLLRRPRRPG